MRQGRLDRKQANLRDQKEVKNEYVSRSANSRKPKRAVFNPPNNSRIFCGNIRSDRIDRNVFSASMAVYRVRVRNPYFCHAHAFILHDVERYSDSNQNAENKG